MKLSHALLAILVAIVWGLNFIFIALGLQEIPPLLLCALRFFFTSIPAVFFIKRPQIHWKLLFSYGLVVFVFQFAFLFLGLKSGMTPGLTSLVVQVQLFFSLFLAHFFLNERITNWQIVGALVAFSGIGVAITHLSGGGTLTGLVFVLAGAFSWGAGNLITKKMGPVKATSLVAWSSLIAFPPLMFLSLMIEGGDLIRQSLIHISWRACLSIGYIVYCSTWLAYVSWNALLVRYPVSNIVPFSLLIPIVGIVGAVITFNEPMEPWKWVTSALVLAGLCIHLMMPIITSKLRVLQPRFGS